MATYVVATHPATAEHHRTAAVSRVHPHSDLRFALLLTLALALFALAIHGYHPFTEDGGLYLAGVEHSLNPALFPHSNAFVLEPTRHSLFAPTVAALVRITHLSLPAAILALHLISLWTTLFAAWLVAQHCWPTRRARAGAVALLACWLGLPVAGTALTVMDPYVTARSISTPCTLLALFAILNLTSDPTRHRRRNLALAAAAILIAALVHPLMAAYALGASLLFLTLRTGNPTARIRRATALCLTAIALASLLQYAAPAESPAYIRIALTRTYWFLNQWQWFEQLGLIAPLILLAFFAKPRTPHHKPTPQQALAHVSLAHVSLAQTALAAGLTGLAISLLFAHAGAPTHLVARLQPLRIFQTIYLLMTLLLGAQLGEHLLRRHLWRWLLALPILAAPMFFAARATYPATPHLELPWLASPNPWVEAFTWVRIHTPTDGLFALDPDYINLPAEDAHCFRAIAQRSALADYSKDGGEVSIAPDLAPEWATEQASQIHLNTEPDSARLTALRPLGVTWLILRASTPTTFTCPYANASAKVCRLPQ